MYSLPIEEILSKLEILAFMRTLPFKEPTCTHDHCVKKWLEEVGPYSNYGDYPERIKKCAYENLELRRLTEKN